MTVLNQTAARCAEGPQEAVCTFSDHELMAAMARGDHGALKDLMERHLKGMLALSQRILGNHAEADEVGQEAFLRLWQMAPRWDAEGAAMVRTWLSRVVTNLCIDRCRRRRGVPLEEAGEIEDASPNAFDKMEGASQKKFVGEMLNTLPERQRAVVALSYFEELSDAETAEIMGLTVGAVESLLVRARRTLRAFMAKRGIASREEV